MKDRRISVNIRKMLDIMHHAEKDDLDSNWCSLSTLLSVLINVVLTFLHGSLEFFGFGTMVREWTKILYHDYSVRIQEQWTLFR